MKRFFTIGAYSLLLFFFALLLLGSKQLSFTADEPAYIAGGYMLLSEGRSAFDLLSQRGYPPLFCVLEAFLVYWEGLDVPLEELQDLNYDALVLEFMPYMQPLERIEFVSRIPVMLLSVILGAVVFRWAKDFWGTTAGFLALCVLVFDPLLVAHGRFAHTDAGSVAVGTLALYMAWRWTKRPSWLPAFGLGVVLGLAMLSKISGVLWTGVAGLMMLSTIFRQASNERFLLFVQVVITGLLSGLVLWAGYALTWGPVTGLPFSVPAPAHWESLRYLTQYTSDVFVAGQRKMGHWWWYYPVAFLIKNPLPLLLGLGFGLWYLPQHTHPDNKPDLFILGLFPLCYIVMAAFQGMDIGYRHMLPIHPFIHLFTGGGLALWSKTASRHGWVKPVWAILGVWYVLGTLRFYPYEISFFNELVGGEYGGYRYLVDSNLDWGQAQKAVDVYVASHPDVRTTPPDNKFYPEPGQYLVPASYLQGVGIGEIDAYAWFRRREPDAILAFSQLIYNVPSRDLQWLAQCIRPAVPLTAESLVRGTGCPDLRVVDFDCENAWIYPGGEGVPGIYALHYDLLEQERLFWPWWQPKSLNPVDLFAARHLTEARFSFEQAKDGDLPAFALYEMPTGAPIYPGDAQVFALPGHSLNVNDLPDSTVSLPLALDGPLVFLGCVAYREGDNIEVETWWRVRESTTRPFSIMGHLYIKAGASPVVADGLGILPLHLQPNDVLVQRHRFMAVPEGADLLFATGAYWAETMESWPVQTLPGVDTFIQVIIPKIVG